ncbi:NapC/NirT family cytochrome c [Phosphitispora sp. TUW77]|uniref:NapC/NirT family cytochrome c n=1 Tax=Phosphitispora sp. TUW77 TaxID=3152361 RepID=UPI003AB88ECF
MGIRNNLKLFILVMGILLFLLLAAVGGFSLTKSPDLCKMCHNAMQPEYVTWQNSSHNNVACMDCHKESNLINMFKEKIGTPGQLFHYYTTDNKEYIPITMKSELPNHLCEQCHSMKTRAFSLPGDLKDPHEYHEKVGVGCVKCHSGVAHGNIAGRSVATDSEIAAWSDKEGKENMTMEFTRPDMDTCVACHINPAKYGVTGVESVTWDCGACHEEIFTPNSHNLVSWTRNHGVDGAGQLKDCVSCHAMGVEPTFVADGVINNVVKSEVTVKDFAWTTEFCINCHSQMPDDHKDKSKWMPSHKNAVQSKGMSNCTACHSIQKPKAGETLPSPAKEVACNKCHWF